MTFRVRTALVVLLLTALTMGGAFAAVWHHFVSTQRTQLDRALLAIAKTEAAAAAAGGVGFTNEPGPVANAVGPLPKYGVHYGADGTAVARTANFGAAPPLPRAPLEAGFDLEHEGTPLRAVLLANARGGHVLLATPRLDLEDDARVLRDAMAVAFLVGCGWAALVAYAVAARLTREHRMAAHVARTVASGDTSARLAYESGGADLRQFADDLNAMIERLVGLLAVQERFIAHAAHELRTPLTSLRIEIEHALHTGKGREDYEAALRGALDSARHLTDLAEDLLQLARSKADHAEADTTVEEALGDAIADVAPVARARDVAIEAPKIDARVRGDRRSLARLFRNVVENAVQFSPAGGKVTVESTFRDGRLLVGVTDEGVGVTAGEEERIFEPFARGSRDRGEGSGLGLAIARNLARAFGGDVTAEPGAGGRFFIALAPATES